MTHTTKLLLLLFLLPATLLHAQDEDLFDFEHSLEFAHYLYKTNQYELAAREFERIHFMQPRDTNIQSMLLKSYRNGKSYSTGVRRAHRWLSQSEALPRPVSIEYAKILILDGRYHQLDDYLGNPNNNFQSEDIHFLRLNNLLLRHKYEASQRLFSRKFMDLPDNQFDTYNHIIMEGLEMKQKSPALAAVMSGVVPGSGRFYTGDWKDGIFSILLMGSVGYGAYSAFSKRGTSSALGWIYGGIGAGLYLGNIYGSYRSAVDFNTKRKRSYEHKIKERIRPYF